MQNELSGQDNIISFLSWSMPNVNEKPSKSAANTSVAYIESLWDTRFKVFYIQLNELFFTYTKITEVELKETKTSLNFNSKNFDDFALSMEKFQEANDYLQSENKQQKKKLNDRVQLRNVELPQTSFLKSLGVYIDQHF